LKYFANHANWCVLFLQISRNQGKKLGDLYVAAETGQERDGGSLSTMMAVGKKQK
jgi:hypothetical protein